MEGSQPTAGAIERISSTQSVELDNSLRETQLTPHPLQEHNDLLSCVQLLDVSNFFRLPRGPLPRCQDLPKEYFGAPTSSADQVVSVSHAWRNQAHPDPTRKKTKLLGQLLSKISSSTDLGEQNEQNNSSLFLFFDFISVPQRPFLAHQHERTEEEMDIFRRALERMHEVYFYSDRIIHLPWEDANVPGEGSEDVISAESLRGCTFAKVGDCVQVKARQSTSQKSWRSARHAITPSSLRTPVTPSSLRTPVTPSSLRTPTFVQTPSSHGANLFDRVLSVDGQIVESVEQLELLLASNAKAVTVHHYPFGNYSNIPADVRGWVFLERFITMVKCAMMDEDMAKQVVITPSSSIFQQIMHGAALLREASLKKSKHNKHSELKQVLESFILELQSKQFAPASTDKRELNATATSLEDDRSVVGRIMRHFVRHLDSQWEAEAAKQRSLARRLTSIVAVAETYLVEWEYFSEEYSAKLAAASTANPWPLAVVILVPLAVASVPLLWPLPSVDDGWASQAEFWGVALPIMLFSCFISFPVFLAKTTGMEYSWNVLLLFGAWAAVCSAICVGAGISIGAAFDAFPIPMLHLVGTAICAASLPTLWWCIPRKQRESQQYRRRLLAAILAMAVHNALFGIAVPLLNASIPLVSEGWQPLLLLCYLGLKLQFEFLGLRLSRVLGADAIPYFVFVASYCYQVNICIAFSKTSSWLLVVEQLLFDIVENAYHVYSLFRQQSVVVSRGSHGGRQQCEDQQLGEQYIVASLMVREFVEVVAPASFLVLHALLRAARPESMDWFCDRSEQEVQQTVHFLMVDIGVEIVGSCLTYLVLIRKNHTPLLLLRGVVATLLFCFTLMAGTTLVFYCAMQHSHWGMDLSFKFQWLAERDSVWKCGLIWQAV